MLVSAIISRVRSIAGDVDVLQFTDEDIYSWINDAMREVAVDNALLQVSATQNTTVNESKYDTPANILKFHSILYDNEGLRVITFEDAKSDGYLTSAVGTPTVAWIWANKINLYPAPDAVKTLEIAYTREPVEVTQPTDTPEIPSSYHMRLVDYCLAQVAQQDDDMQRYAMKMEEFRTGVQNLKDIPEWENNLYPTINVSGRDSGWDYGEY